MHDPANCLAEREKNAREHALQRRLERREMNDLIRDTPRPVEHAHDHGGRESGVAEEAGNETKHEGLSESERRGSVIRVRRPPLQRVRAPP